MCRCGGFFGLFQGCMHPIDSYHVQELQHKVKMLSRSLHTVGQDDAMIFSKGAGVSAREDTAPVVLWLPEWIFKKQPVVWLRWGAKKQPLPQYFLKGLRKQLGWKDRQLILWMKAESHNVKLRPKVARGKKGSSDRSCGELNALSAMKK